VERGIVVRADVAAGEDLLDVPVERRVDRHHVFEAAVMGHSLTIRTLPSALDDLRFDLARLISVKGLRGEFRRRGSAGGFRARNAGTGNRSRAASPAEA